MTHTGRQEVAGELILVATPIGNLGDLSPRAVEVLRTADSICAEDTRRTHALLTAAGIPGKGRMTSLHEHNEQTRIPTVLNWLAEGRRVALVSDAGTPAVSDPGAALVAAVAEAGYRISVVPGPSSILAALVVSGLPTERFCMEGFLPRRGAKRTNRLAALAGEQRTTIVLEAPSRLVATLEELLEHCGDRPVAVVRELTKMHEEIWRGSLHEAASGFGSRDVRGEIVIVLGGATPPEPPGSAEISIAVAEMLDTGAGVRETADAVSRSLKVSRREVYELASEMKRRGNGEQTGP